MLQKLFELLKNLLEERENALGQLICLSKHRLGSLCKDLLLCEVHHFLRHVSITDLRLSRCEVLNGYVQVVDLVFQTVLDSTECTTNEGYLVDSLVDLVDSLVSVLLSRKSELISAETLSCAVEVSSKIADSFRVVLEGKLNSVLSSCASLEDNALLVGHKSFGVLERVGYGYLEACSSFLSSVGSLNNVSLYGSICGSIVSVNINLEL